jgi:AhpD family alkylhydroperoxidase
MNENGYGKRVLEELRPLHRELRHAIPDVYEGFSEFHHAAFASGELGAKNKELIALAIGVIQRCDGCIASHAEGAARTGATRQEAAEAIGVAMLMNGGPATIYGPRAYAAFCEFAPEPDTDGEPTHHVNGEPAAVAVG